MGALGDPYAGVGDLAQRLNTDDTFTFPALLDAASRAVEDFCKRQFNKTTSATARRFRPLDWRRLPVDDFHTVTGLVVDVDGTVWAGTAYDPQPWGGVRNGVTGWPFFDLFAVNQSWPMTATITVTAQWGWAAVPEAVKQATLNVAATMFRTGGANPVRSEAIDGYSVTFQLPSVNGADVPPEMSRVVPYRRRRFGVA